MAARAPTGHPPSSEASYVPFQLSPLDALLASRISLPPNSIICYALLKSPSVDSIELARRSVLSRYADSPIKDSILTTVSIGQDPQIYFFMLGGSSSADTLRHLTFDGLTTQEISFFSPPNASLLFPDDDKQLLIVRFFDALRCRLIQDIVDSASKQASFSQRQIKRYKNGFLMSQISSPSGWEYKSITRSLVYCRLQIHFSYTSEGVPSHLVIHPMLLSTPFLDISPSLPLPAGAPITLLPFGTPAYFLGCYSGSTASLTKQFHTALQGLGAGDWDNSASPIRPPTFIIGWIKVENKQGEDKGLPIIYPTKLCLSCLPLASSRDSLDYIPDLPAPIQPSPQASRLRSTSESTGSAPITMAPCQYSFISSPTSESFGSYRDLMIAASGLERVTAEVGEYIDAVARERERERERLRREREIGTVTTPKATQRPPTTPMLMPMPIESIELSTSSSTISSTPPPVPLLSTSPELLTPQTMPSTAVQTFYPSPPQSCPTLVPPTDAKAGPLASIAPERSKSQGAFFDSYDMEPNWSRPKDGYLDMDFVMNNIGLEFNLDMGPMANASSAGTSMTSFDGRDGTAINTAGIEFEDAFTDDDFNFFDRPSRPNQPSNPPSDPNGHASSSLFSTGNPIGLGISPPNFKSLYEPHCTQSTTHLHTPGGFMDNFTPCSLVDHLDSGPPGLLPSSPTPTPESLPSSTPTVHLDVDSSPKQSVAIAESLSQTSIGLFEPIPFAAFHREADDKYAVGKFALPSPPSEAGCMPVSLLTPPRCVNSGWRFEYKALTDPSVGLVKKLIGVKRKLPTLHSKSNKLPSKKVFWTIGDNWDGEEETQENEESDGDSIQDAQESDVSTPSRPTTPAPSYLPLGPTLITAQFQHSHLLSLSIPLRPPGAAIPPLTLGSTNNPTLSVPTPVSPAAMMGATSERSLSLEAAASAIAVEVVENPLWAESWNANVVDVNNVGEVWATDIKAVQKLLKCIPGLETPLSVAELFGLADAESDNVTASGSELVLEAMEAPMISIGKGEAVIQVLPPALRFWEKLGLSPKGGLKNVAAFFLFEENARNQPFIEKWLMAFRNAYQAKHYGFVTPGQSTLCAIDGLLPIRFDATFRKSLSAFVSSLTAPRLTTVVFLVLPIAILSLSSPVLRQILSASKKVSTSYYTCKIIFELVPEQHIYTGHPKSSAYESTLDILAASVYNRILVPFDRLKPERIDGLDGRKDEIRSYFMAPSFTLARPMHNKVFFLRAAHTSLDVMDRYTLLHVAYHLTPCGKWIIACCVDQRGENYDLDVWLTQSPGEHEGETEYSAEDYAVKKVWDFAMQFAKKTNVEWRVVFAKLGALSQPELEVWNVHLGKALPSRGDETRLHFSLVCVIPDTPWFYLPSTPRRHHPSRSSPSSVKHQIIFTDVSSTTYAIFPNIRLPVSRPPSLSELLSGKSFIPEPLIYNPNVVSSPFLQPMQPVDSPFVPSRSLAQADRQLVPLLPLSSSILIRVPHLHDSTTASSNSMTHIHLLRTYHSASYRSRSTSVVSDDKQFLADVTRNYYELSVLSKTRWKLDGISGNTGLPFHLAATDAMSMALDKDWDVFDSNGEP